MNRRGPARGFACARTDGTLIRTRRKGCRGARARTFCDALARGSVDKKTGVFASAQNPAHIIDKSKLLGYSRSFFAGIF
jgi:hypothetical protein